MIKLFIEPEQPAPEITALRTELEKLRGQLDSRTTLFSEILTGQQKILDAIQLDMTKTAENHLLAQSLATMLQTLTDQMADHLQQLASDCTQSEPDSLPGTAARLEASK